MGFNLCEDFKVWSVNGAAEAKGVKTGDAVRAVQGVSVEGLDFDNVLERIRFVRASGVPLRINFYRKDEKELSFGVASASKSGAAKVEAGGSVGAEQKARKNSPTETGSPIKTRSSSRSSSPTTKALPSKVALLLDVDVALASPTRSASGFTSAFPSPSPHTPEQVAAGTSLLRQIVNAVPPVPARSPPPAPQAVPAPPAPAPIIQSLPSSAPIIQSLPSSATTTAATTSSATELEDVLAMVPTPVAALPPPPPPPQPQPAALFSPLRPLSPQLQPPTASPSLSAAVTAAAATALPLKKSPLKKILFFFTSSKAQLRKIAQADEDANAQLAYTEKQSAALARREALVSLSTRLQNIQNDVDVRLANVRAAALHQAKAEFWEISKPLVWEKALYHPTFK